MAKVAYSPAIEGLRGKVGGAVYAEGGSGPIAKAYVVGNDPRSAAQMTMRHWMTLSAAYRNLTDAQAATWEGCALSVVRHNGAMGRQQSLLRPCHDELQ